jgi:WD40 repeat protein
MFRRLVGATRGSYETALLVSTRSVEWLLDRLFRAMGRWVPEDIFISYARVDGSRYAMALAAELASHNRNCITDVFAAETGQQIPPGLSRALRRARQLVVLGTDGAIGSEGIAWEVQNFPRDGRSVVIIGFCDAVKDASWFLQGFDPQRESSDRVATGEPSPDIVRTILEAYKFKTQQQRLAIFAVGVLLLVIVAGGAIASYYTYVARTADRKRIAAEAELEATTRRLESEQKELAATTQKMEGAQRDLAATTQRLEGTQTDLQLTDARRTVLDIAARRRALGYTPIEDVVRALDASRELMDRRFPVEAEAALRDNVDLIPHFKTRFRIDPKGPMTLAGNPPRLFAASGQSVEVWDPLQGVTVGSALAHEDVVKSLQFAGRDRWLLVTTEDQAVTLWDLATSTQRHRTACPGKVRSSALSRDGRLLAIACDDVVEVTDVNSGGSAKPLWRLSPVSSAPKLVAVQFARAEGLLLLLSDGDNNPGQRLTAYQLTPGSDPRRLGVDINCLGGGHRWASFSPDGDAILSTSGLSRGGNNVCVCSNLRVELGKNDLAFHFIDLEHTNEVWRTDVGGMRPWTVTVGSDSAARLWDGLGKVVREISPLGDVAERSSRGFFFSGDGAHILLAKRDQQRWLVESQSGDTVAVLPAPERTSDFDFNKNLVAFVTDGEVQVWETQRFRTPERYAPMPHDRLAPFDSMAAFVGSQTYAEGRAL